MSNNPTDEIDSTINTIAQCIVHGIVGDDKAKHEYVILQLNLVKQHYEAEVRGAILGETYSGESSGMIEVSDVLRATAKVFNSGEKR